jgi:2-amino-4-hydroxy-6-hydroxymethyldihydropteridine diphosphokinase
VPVIVTAFVGLGANLGDPIAQLDKAFTALAELPNTRFSARSSYYRTAPVGRVMQADFINAVCRLETALPAIELLNAMTAIERRSGRVRGERDGPRTLDLDLLLYGTQVLHTDVLTLPHPRLHERAFVLAPLAEIAPTLEIPGHGPVETLLSACAGQRVQVLRF